MPHPTAGDDWYERTDRRIAHLESGHSDILAMLKTNTAITKSTNEIVSVYMGGKALGKILAWLALVATPIISWWIAMSGHK